MLQLAVEEAPDATQSVAGEGPVDCQRAQVAELHAVARKGRALVDLAVPAEVLLCPSSRTSSVEEAAPECRLLRALAQVARH